MKIKTFILLVITVFIITGEFKSPANEDLCEKTEGYIVPWNGYCKNSNAQFQNDIRIFYQTMFPSHERDFLDKLLASKEYDQTRLIRLIDDIKARRNFVKRLFIAIAWLGVKYIDAKMVPNKKGKEKEKELTKGEVYDVTSDMEDDNLKFWEDLMMEDPHQWPHPLASVFGHGGRLLIDINTEKDERFKAENFIYFLITGSLKSSSDPTGILDSRTAGSHGVVYKKIGNRFVAMEIKVKLNVYRHLRNVGSHKGIDIPLGGIGNLDPFGLVIGPEGKRYNAEKLDKASKGELKGKITGWEKKITSDKIWGSKWKHLFSLHLSKFKYQHGHFYIFLRDYNNLVSIFSKKHVRSVVMIGLEGNAPGKANMWGHVHTWTNAFGTPKEPGVTGGRKWKAIRQDEKALPVPASYGGKRIYVEVKDLKKLEEICRKVLSANESAQQAFFRALLSKNASGAKTVFQRY